MAFRNVWLGGQTQNFFSCEHIVKGVFLHNHIFYVFIQESFVQNNTTAPLPSEKNLMKTPGSVFNNYEEA